MSPEQVQAQQVDGRSDIFCFGALLYEMITSHRPFVAESTPAIFSAILPPPIARYLPEAPAELQRIVSKALRKDREERYQVAKDLLFDLKILRDELTFVVKQSTDQMSGKASTIARLDVKYLKSIIKRYKAMSGLALVALIITLASIPVGLYKLFFQSKTTSPINTTKISRVTTNGKARDVAISPDGKYIVYVVEDAGQQSLFVKRTATNSNAQVVSPAEGDYKGLTFSPDGNFIYYVRGEKNASFGVLYVVPLLGGAAKFVLTDVNGPITFSPDGKQFAFVRYNREGNQLMIGSIDGNGERTIAIRTVANRFAPNPAWSPDGKVIACFARGFDDGKVYYNLVEVRIEDGAEKPIISNRWISTGSVAWLPDGSGLITFFANEARNAQIWQVSYPDGKMQRITNDTNHYHALSLAANSLTLATIQSGGLSNIWIVRNGDTSHALQITHGIYEAYGVEGLCWTPDGRIVTSTLKNAYDIWIMNSDGRNEHQLTVDAGFNFDPSVSPDGRYIVFASDRTGALNIWRMNIDGNNPKQLTKGPYELSPSCSPDGLWVVYSSHNAGKTTLWKVGIDGGDPLELTDADSSHSAISLVGSLLAYFKFDHTYSIKIAVSLFKEKAPVKLLDIPSTTDKKATIQWAPEGHALTYINERQGVFNIWSQPLDGSRPKQLTDFKSDRIFNFAWSRDGQYLACSRGLLSDDVVLISDFK